MKTPFLFFGGKGGVGKTTCAAAAALRRADTGRRVLLVSTDPAHSLGDALGLALGAEPVPIPARRGHLLAAELDAESALDRWLGPRRAGLATLAERGTPWLAREDVHRLLDLGLPGIDELIGLLELLRLARENPGDTVVVDTAPTAHTLRLLAMPGELRRFAQALEGLQARHRAVATAFGRPWQPDRADALIAEIEAEGRALETLLRDPEQTSFFWVLLPERLSVEETKDGVAALEKAGIPVAGLIVNRVTPPPDAPCAGCAARRQAEREAIAALRAAFPERVLRFLPALPREPRGRAALRGVGRWLAERKGGGSSPLGGGGLEQGGGQEGGGSNDPGNLRGHSSHPPPSLPPFPTSPTQGGGTRPPWIADLVPTTTRLLLLGGKGGTGKTTCAAAAALLLAEARPGQRVLLLSTDPAHSLGDALDVPLGDDPRPVPRAPANLRARELDAARTFDAWRARHLSGIDELQGLLDLAPPGLDELSAVSALIDALQEEDLVIVDTAPTGHALRLLEAPALLQSWVKELLTLLLDYREAVPLGRLAEELVELSRNLRHLGEVLHDPARTRFLAVTRAAELPRRETLRLLAALERLDLAVPAVLVDAVVSPACPACAGEAAREAAEIRTLRRELGRAGREGCAIISAPAAFPPPRGVPALRAWAGSWTLLDDKASREP